MKHRIYLFIIYYVFAVSSGFSQAWKQYPYLPEGSLISFPADAGHHTGENVEWWYTSGHLTGAVQETNTATFSPTFIIPL